MTAELLTEYLPVPGGRIAYDIRGTGPLVLLVPGMGDLRSTYRFLAPALVAAGHAVVTVDLRGHGDSDTTFTSYGDIDTAADIGALLREFGTSAVIVGNSMGAGSAVIVAAEKPHLVDGLVLIGPFVREPASGSAFGRAMMRIALARPWASAMWRAYLPRLYAGRKPADFAIYLNRVIAAMNRPGYARAFSLTSRTDHRLAGESLAAVTAPTLVVMGEKDPDFADPRAEADWISEALNGSPVMIADAGHYPQSQQPEATAEAITRFLGTLKPRS